MTCFSILLAFVAFATDKNERADKKEKTGNYPEHGIFSGKQESNLVTNADFENETSSWFLGKYNGGNGIFTTDTIHVISGRHSAVVSTENIQQDEQDVQLFSFFQLSEKTRYSISFKARVKRACLISISISNGYETYFEENLLLTPETMMYGPLHFKSEVDDAFTFFSFNLGETHQTLCFDDIEIQADYTDKKFDEVIANTGINIWPVDGNSEFYIHLPTTATEDYPVLFLDEKGKTIKTDKIDRGLQEKQIALNAKFVKGNYTLKVFTPSRALAYNFEIK